MKTIYKILSAIAVILIIFFAGFFTQKYTGKNDNKIETDTIFINNPKIIKQLDTITEIDTLTNYISNIDTIIKYINNRDTIYLFDTIIAYLNDYDTKRTYDTTLISNDVEFKFRANVYRNRLTSYQFNITNNRELKGLYFGGSLIYLEKPYLFLNGAYQKEKNLYQIGISNKGFQFGYLRKF